MPPFPAKNNKDPTEKNMVSWLPCTGKTRGHWLPRVRVINAGRGRRRKPHGAWGSAMPALSALKRLRFQTSLGYISKKKQIKRHWAERRLSCQCLPGKPVSLVSRTHMRRQGTAAHACKTGTRKEKQVVLGTSAASLS